MRVAVIGCGSIGMRHVKNALALGCEVTAIEQSGERRDMLTAQFPAVEVTYGWDVSHDAAIVATPYDEHYPYAELAVGAGKPLFVEKPLGSLDEIEDWRQLVQASASLITQVGYQCRFHPKARAMKLLFQKQPERGMLEVGTFYCYCDISTWPGASYGPLLLEASHDIDLALWLGAPGQVERVHRTDQETSFCLGDRWNVCIGSRREYLRVWSVGTLDDEGATVAFESPEELGDEMYVDELKHFLDCVQSGRQTDVPLADGLRVLEVCQQVEAMARQHA